MRPKEPAKRTSRTTPAPKGEWEQTIRPIPGTLERESGGQYRVQLRDDIFIIFADSIQVTANGDLLGMRKGEAAYCFAAGAWLFCVPVSVIDGSEVVVAWHSRWLHS